MVLHSLSKEPADPGAREPWEEAADREILDRIQRSSSRPWQALKAVWGLEGNVKALAKHVDREPDHVYRESRKAFQILQDSVE